MRVVVAARAGELTLSVADDGCGMADALPVDGPAGIGMQSMRTRAARLQGVLTVHSSERGTRVELCCPIDPGRLPARPAAPATALATSS